MAPRSAFCCVFVTRGPIKKHDDLVGGALLEASLGNSYTLAKAMCTRDTSRPAGSEARGEGRERGNLLVTTSKPPVAQGAGGIIDARSFCRSFMIADASSAASCHILFFSLANRASQAEETLKIRFPKPKTRLCLDRVTTAKNQPTANTK